MNATIFNQKVWSQCHVFSPTDVSTFRARHPVTTYEHYRELIGRVAAGEERVILAERPLILAMTSGTSAASAMLLSTGDTNSEFFKQVGIPPPSP